MKQCFPPRRNGSIVTCFVCFMLLVRSCATFQSPFAGIHCRKVVLQLPLLASKNDINWQTTLMEEIKAMRVREIKVELSGFGISSNDIFEKEELVRRLFIARKSQAESMGTALQVPPVPPDAIRGPLFFTKMTLGQTIHAFNQANLRIDSVGQPYPTIRVDVPQSTKPNFSLTLLLDTACSGLVLRPSTANKYNLPTFKSPVTMTGAGGTSQANGLTQLNRFVFGGMSFGPMPAALQDISGLPAPLDGIIGLSWLNQFACVEIDFWNGQLTLFRSDKNPPIPKNLEVVAEAEMSMASLGIWYIDVTMDGRGPVKMLVDTGAASSFLSWEGVRNLGLSRESELVVPLREKLGAMGSDNIAMELTHRVTVENNLNLGVRSKLTGMSIGPRKILVDVGNIAVLDMLQKQGDQINGILGIDAFSICSMVRMTCQGPVPKLTFLQDKPS